MSLINKKTGLQKVTSKARHKRGAPWRKFLFILLATALFLCGIVFASLFMTPSTAKEQRPPREWVNINAEVNTIDRRTAPLAIEGDPDNVFDCEDYAWTKYHMLKAAGVAADRMKLYAVRVANGTHHMILVVDDWVLDNLEPRLEPEEKARGYYENWEERSPNKMVIILP